MTNGALDISLVDKRHILIRNLGLSPEKSCKNQHFPNAEKAEARLKSILNRHRRAGHTIKQITAHIFTITG